MACACQGRNLVRDQIGSESGDLSADARSFTGEDGNLPFGNGLHRMDLARRADTFYPLHLKCEVWRIVSHCRLLPRRIDTTPNSKLWQMAPRVFDTYQFGRRFLIVPCPQSRLSGES